MKILRVIASMNPMSGGPCQGIRNAIPELEKIGITSEVVCLDDPQSAFLGTDNFKVTALGPTKTPWQYSNLLFPWLLENIINFDAVIIHGLWLYHGYAVKKAIDKLTLKKTKIPKVYVMPHGMLDPYFQNNETRKLKAIRNSIYWRLIESKIVNNASGVLFTCQAELELARNTFRPYHPKHELNVGYGIQTPPAYHDQMKEAFIEKCEGLNRNFILFLSRIHYKKGVDLLIKAYESNAQINKEELPQLIIAGPGIDSEYGEKISNMVNSNPLLKGQIIFTGMLSGNSKWGAFYLCDAFILPSHQENFGIAVAESLACAKPVLISNQVNIYKEIQKENAGVIAKDNLDGTTNLLNTWLKLSIEEKKQMSDKTLFTFNKYFTIQSAAKSFKTAIQS